MTTIHYRNIDQLIDATLGYEELSFLDVFSR